MQKKKLKKLRNELSEINHNFIEEKKLYTLENAKKLKKEGEIYYKFFIGRKKNIIKNYREKQNEKQAEINKFQNLQGKELFKAFTNDEQINYIGISKGGKKKKKSTVEGSTELQTEINN